MASNTKVLKLKGSYDWILGVEVEGQNEKLKTIVDKLKEKTIKTKKKVTGQPPWVSSADRKELLKCIEVEDDKSGDETTSKTGRGESIIQTLKKLIESFDHVSKMPHESDFEALATIAQRIKYRNETIRSLVDAQEKMTPNNCIIVGIMSMAVNSRSNRSQSLVKKDHGPVEGTLLDKAQELRSASIAAGVPVQGSDSDIDKIWDICEWIMENPRHILDLLSREFEGETAALQEQLGKDPELTDEESKRSVNIVNKYTEQLNTLTEQYKARYPQHALTAEPEGQKPLVSINRKRKAEEQPERVK